MRKSNKNRPLVYEVITDRVVKLLGEGTIPWHKPWSAESGHPRNAASQRKYRGVNAFLLACVPYDSAGWLTYKQAQTLGGHVRKGEKSMPVIFWKWLEKTDKETGEKNRIPLLRYYNVFNVRQCDLPENALPPEPQAAPDREFTPLEQCERLVQEWSGKPSIAHDSTQAFYRPKSDSVHLPRVERFESSEEFYSVLFHELTHATGHESRLNRPGIADVAAFGSNTYSREELVAEMGAAFLCGHCGIENATIENSAAYVQGWLSRLRGDSKLVVQAAAQAQKAADLILGTTWDADDSSEG